jgi:hypothetical protein
MESNRMFLNKGNITFISNYLFDSLFIQGLFCDFTRIYILYVHIGIKGINYCICKDHIQDDELANHD